MVDRSAIPRPPMLVNRVPTDVTPHGQHVAYPGVPAFDAHEAFGFKADFLSAVHLVLRRKWLILAITFVVLGLGTVRTLMQTPLYTSSVRLQIEHEALRVVEDGNLTSGRESAQAMETQLQVLASRSMADRVAANANLPNDLEFYKPRNVSLLTRLRTLWSNPPSPEKAPPDRVQLLGHAAGILLGNVSVRPVGRSNIVEIAYTDPDGTRAQRIASAYAVAFVAASRDRRFEANAYAKTFLEDQIAQLKIRLQASEGELVAFAEREQILAPQDRQSVAETGFASASAELGELMSARVNAEQDWRQVEKADGINLPQLLSNQVIEGLRAARNDLRRTYEQKLETFKPNYPEMLESTRRIAEIDRQLTTEVETVRGSLRAAYDTAVARESEMRARIDGLRQDVLNLQHRSARHNILQREVDTNRELYKNLLQRLKAIDVASGVNASNAFVVDAAQVPGSPSSPDLKRALLMALLAGLGLGAGLAYLLEMLDDRVGAPEEIEALTGLPTLGLIPRVRNDVALLDAVGDPRSPVSEAYRTLASGLQFTSANGVPKTILVTSAGPAEGKSVTALAIARHFATLGLKVLLVDADLRNPSLHLKLRCDNTAGLSTYLGGICTPPQVIQKTSAANLAFMASGPLPPAAADLLAGDRMRSLLSVGLEVFDHIIVDGPPVMGLADAQLLSSVSEATVFCASAGSVRRGAVRAALKRLHLSRAIVVGTVLTKFDARAASYGYGYGYGTGYAYGTPISSPVSNANAVDLRPSTRQ